MRNLTKKCSFVGENGATFEFNLGIDRNIVCQSFQEFPDLIEYLMQQEKEVGKGDISEADYLLKLIKSKQLKQALSVTEDIGEMVKFALPLMLEKAEDKTNYHKIIDYIDENGIKDEFNSAVFGFISLGFTLGEQGKKPKVKFAMK